MASIERATAKVGDGGRLVIPAPFRKALGIRPGDTVILKIENGELHITSRTRAVKWAQEELRRHVPEGFSLVDELITQRRRESVGERTAASDN